MGYGTTGYIRSSNDSSRIYFYARDVRAGLTASTSHASLSGNFEGLSNCPGRRKSNHTQGFGQACAVQTMGAAIS